MVVPDMMAEEPSPGETPRVVYFCTYVFKYKRAPRGKAEERHEVRAKTAGDQLRKEATPAEVGSLDLWLKEWRGSQKLNGESADGPCHGRLQRGRCERGGQDSV